MSSAELELSSRLIEIRRAFDESFARPPTTAATSAVGLIAVRVAAHPYAFRIDDLADVHQRCKVVPVPGAHPNLLGIAGIRGRMVPVYSLAALLGYDRRDEWRWLALCRSKHDLGLTFDELEYYLQASPRELFPRAAGEDQGSDGYVRDVLRQDGATRQVIHTTSIIAALRDAAGHSAKGS